MDPMMIGLLGFLLFFLFIAMRMPIAYAMLITGIFGIGFINAPNVAFKVVATELYGTFSSYSLSVIPLFTWMGFLAFYSGIGGRLFTFAYKAIGHLPGGLAIAAQATSAIFGAISGSSIATSATIGSIAIPEMRKHGYDVSLATASVAAGGILGVLIPPSTIFIVYGVITENSIGSLFISGIIPGILLTLMYIGVIYFITRRNPDLAPLAEKATWKERMEAFKHGGLLEVVIVFVVSLGGLFVGWFTPTEAGAVGAAGVLVITVVTKQLSWAALKSSLYDTLNTIAMIMFLIAGANVFGRFIAITRLPFELGTWIEGLPLPPFVVMSLILLIYVIMGFVMDALALILLTVPIFYPTVVNTLGYDPIWFGVIIVLVAGAGVITPPVGINVYVIKGIAPDVPLEKIFKGIWPFLYAIIALIVLLMVVPEVATFLPNLLIK
ncbi:TRAP transporter large permease [Desulfosporosinus sp. BICA1-9]|uniref:TRAP transporter large permease n=1 Tax=Desulfosporosinus sp. BICA1-9 TaxID=1531958 RepID=UPI00054BCD9D|nr:TRAP transporter large permease [Desulfosporosinus sp. BICA1-9]KJS82481.1 MAG: C4-dicarboxylate ABC transporter permease [Desulfosporosinus sp. BICA1-9]HBW35856.1 TRAP transporter large permease [Desulfosporosinus sp.]